MNKYLYLTIYICAFFQASAQNFNNRYYWNWGAASGRNLCVTKSGKYAINGAVAANTVDNGKTQLFFALINEDGTTDTIKYYGEIGFHFQPEEASLHELADGSFAGLGFKEDTAAFLMLFIKYDNSGNLLFYKTYNTEIDTDIIV